jgi:hypothetical protein
MVAVVCRPLKWKLVPSSDVSGVPSPAHRRLYETVASIESPSASALLTVK